MATGKRAPHPHRCSRISSDTGRVLFRLTAAHAHHVFIAGSFNGWDPRRHAMRCGRSGEFSTRLSLSRGRHEYTFVVDGEWIADPACDHAVTNGHGTLNSVRKV